MMSAILSDALETYSHMREDLELYRHAIYLRAHAEPRGEPLGACGRAARIDPHSLFRGSQSRVPCFGSEELERWFEIMAGPTVEEFEAQWWSGRGLTGAGAGPLRALV